MGIGTLIDKAIGEFSPVRGLARMYHRQLLERAYDAASPRDGWKPRRGGASADADHFGDATTMRNKARSLVQNVPYCRAMLEALVSQVVGTGITPSFTGAGAEALAKLWAQWVPLADADGGAGFYALQGLAYRAMEQDGEVLLRRRPRRPTDALPVPLQVQLLEVDWIDTTRQRGAAQGNEIVNGVEYDGLGRKVAYFLWQSHPGDSGFRRFMRRVSGLQSVRVMASDIIHLYRSERPGQGRGFTRFAPVISRVRDLQLYEDSEIARKNLESRLSVLASGDVASMAEGYKLGETPDYATAKVTGEMGQLAGGAIMQLPPGVNVSIVDPKPAGGYVDYLKLNLHVITAGFGVPYEMATGDMNEVNFSSARVRQSDFRRQCEQTQWLLLVPVLCQGVLAWFAEAAQLVGKAASATAEWSTPKWDYVNPGDEVKADIDEISMGLSSISEKLRRRGYDPKAVFAELKSDFDTLQSMGVLDVMLMLQKGKTAQAAAATPAAAPAPAKPAAKGAKVPA